MESKVTKISKSIATTILLMGAMASTTANAQTAREVYEANFSNKETGVYQQDNWLYFVVKQPCLTEKKFAGTAESKKAEKTFYGLFAQEVIKRKVTFSDDIQDIKEPLRFAIKQDVASQFKVQTALKHQLLFDRNSKADTCIQEYVVVLDNAQFQPNGVVIPRSMVEQSAVKHLLASVDDQEHALTVSYLDALGLTPLAEIYRLQLLEQPAQVNFALDDFPASCSGSYCSLESQRFSPYDIHSVVMSAIKHQGITRIENIHASDELAQIFYQQAKSNFVKGTKAQAIINDLTLALNLQPKSAQSWKLLADIARALGKHDLGRAASRQYIAHNTESAEAWVYAYLSEMPFNPELSEKLKHWLQLINQKHAFSPWAQKQISGH